MQKTDAEQVREEILRTAEDNERQLQELADEANKISGDWVKLFQQGKTEECDAIRKRVAEITEERKKLRHGLDAKLRRKLYVKPNAQGELGNVSVGYSNVTGSTSAKEAFARRIDADFKQFTRYIDGNILETAKTNAGTEKITVNIIEPYARAYRDGNTIAITQESKRSHVIHELGHWLEDENPSIKTKMADFYKKRTINDVWEPLGEPGFNAGEFTKKDKFIDPYMGKGIMGKTEIMSMGLQYFEEAPLVLAKGDPEYFDLIFNAIRGIE